MEVIFCAYFCESWAGWPACRSMWHEDCYSCLGEGVFPLKVLTDKIGTPWHTQAARSWRLNHGVKGVHAFLVFQCEVCWLRNLEGRDPRPNNADEAYLMSICWANFDSMSSHAAATIKEHAREVLRSVANSQHIGKTL